METGQTQTMTKENLEKKVEKSNVFSSVDEVFAHIKTHVEGGYTCMDNEINMRTNLKPREIDDIKKEAIKYKENTGNKIILKEKDSSEAYEISNYYGIHYFLASIIL